MKPKVRFWIYSILVASAPICIYYGILKEQEVTLWIAFASVALGIAARNVPPTD